MKILTFDLKVAVGDNTSHQEVKTVIERLTKSPMTQNISFVRSRYVENIKDPDNGDLKGLQDWLKRAREEIK